MPCGCFGGGKKSKAKIGDGLKDPTPPPIGQSTPTTKLKERSDGVPSKTAKKNDVVAAHEGEECALLGFRTTGSRPPSSVVDSPNSNSHTHTPSTAPIAASATSSQNTSLSHSPSSGGRHAAMCRAQLAEKRREFFRDFIPDDYKSSPYALSSSSSNTLPTASRAQKFGKVRTARPLSQPHSPDSDAPPPPPGPHLLRHTPVSPKIESDDSGFCKPEFLLELKNASEEISRRWAMSDDEDPASPSSLRMRPRPRSPPNLIDTDPFFQSETTFEHNEENPRFHGDFSTHQENKFEADLDDFEDDENTRVKYDCEANIIEENLCSRLTPSPEVIEHVSLEERSYPAQSHPSLPQTMITPPSPPVHGDDLLFKSSTSQPLPTEPSDASSDEENDGYEVHLDHDTQAQMVELLSRQNDYDDDDDDACMDDDFRDRENSKLLLQDDDDDKILHNEPVITFSEDTLINYSEDIRRSPYDDETYLFSSDDVDLLGNVKVDDDVNIVISKEVTGSPFTLPGIEEEEHSDNPTAAAKDTAFDERHDIDSPMDDSPSELESLSTTGNTTDKRKIDQNESIHLHDDGLGSEIDEGSDIIDEQHQQQKKQPPPVGEITFKEKSST